MPVALLPASAAPVTAPFAAPATAPITTSLTTFFALLITPGDERFFVDFFPALFLVALADIDFLATDFLLAFFAGNVFLLCSDGTRYDFDPLGFHIIDVTGHGTDISFTALSVTAYRKPYGCRN